MKKLFFFFLSLCFLLPLTLLAQEEKVAVNRRSAVETLDVEGTLRVRDLPENNATNRIFTQADKTRSTSKNQTFKMRRILLSDANGVLGWGQNLNVPFFTIPSFVLPMKEADTYENGLERVGIHFLEEDLTGSVFEIDLYALYQKNYASTEIVRSPGATDLSTLRADELDYFLTYYDTENIEFLELSDEGKLIYIAKAPQKTQAKTYINITLKPKKQF